MQEDFHSPYHPYNEAGPTAEGRLIYEEGQRRAQQAENARARFPAGTNVELPAFGKKFLGFGLVLLGLWIAPGAGASVSAWILPCGLLALGALGFFKGIRESREAGWQPFARIPGPRGSALRMIWALRPRSWMIAWAAIIGAFALWGAPNLRIAYGPGTCTYFGLGGTATERAHGPCPLIKMIALAARTG